MSDLRQWMDEHMNDLAAELAGINSQEILQRGVGGFGMQQRAIALLSVLVLLTTGITLKKNADTLERLAACGIAEHLHGAECYDAGGALICGLTEHVQSYLIKFEA